MYSEREVRYRWCWGAIFWLVLGILFIASGATALLYLTGVWTRIEVEYAGVAVLILLGTFIIERTVKVNSR